MLTELDEAPDFTLQNTAGETVELASYLANGPVVVLTNRGYWCSYCAEQLQTFSDLSYDLWRNHNTTILPIIGDPVPKLVEMRDRFELTIQLLSDTDLSVSDAYAGIESTDRHGDIPLAGTFVIDPTGIVQYVHIAENPADRTYANYVRHLIRNDYDRPYSSP